MKSARQFYRRGLGLREGNVSAPTRRPWLCVLHGNFPLLSWRLTSTKTLWIIRDGGKDGAGGGGGGSTYE